MPAQLDQVNDEGRLRVVVTDHEVVAVLVAFLEGPRVLVVRLFGPPAYQRRVEDEVLLRVERVERGQAAGRQQRGTGAKEQVADDLHEVFGLGLRFNETPPAATWSRAERR